MSGKNKVKIPISKSKIWRHFEKKTNEFSVCRICSKLIKTCGNTTNLHAHLKKMHKNIYNSTFLAASAVENVNNNNNDVVDDDNEMYTKSNQTEDTDAEIMEKSDCPSPSPCLASSSSSIFRTRSGRGISTNHFTQKTVSQCIKNINDFSEGGNKSGRVSDAIAKFIVWDNLPFLTVEGNGFRNLMKEIAPLYKVPSRNTIKDIIDKKYEYFSNIFKEKMSGICNFVITTDIWTDQNMTSYLGVTVHFLESSKLVSVTLGVKELDEPHKSEYIGKEFQCVLGNWNITNNNVLAVITDNGFNIVKAVQEALGKNKHIPCFAHTINLVVNNVLKSTNSIKELLDKVRTFIVWVRKSVNLVDQLRKHQKDKGIPDGKILKLILDVKTRWNSTYYMVQRFIDLSAICSQISFNNLDAPSFPSATEIQILKEVVVLLKPFEKMTVELSAEKIVTLSKVIPMIHCVRAEYENYIPKSDIAHSLKSSITAELDKRFGNIEKMFLPSIATLLDPRFKQIHFKDKNALGSLISFLNNEIKHNNAQSADDSSMGSESDSASISEEFDLWSYHKKLVHSDHKRRKSRTGPAAGDDVGLRIRCNEIPGYLSTPVTNLRQDSLETWEEMKNIYPGLYKEAQKYLCILATSVPSERLFSKAGVTQTKTRNRLSGKRLSKLLFLNSVTQEYWK